MERKIGEVFEHQGVNVKVVATEYNNCDNCCFLEENAPCSRIRTIAGECLSRKRTDKKSVIFMEAKDEQPQGQAEQTRELNLCEILKYCPRGGTFWSPMFGDVMYNGIIKGEVCVTVASGERIIINADGTLKINFVTSPEVMLYPSKEQRDWSKFTAPWLKKEKFDPKTLKPFDKIIFKGHGMWFCGLFSHIHNSYACVGETYYKCVIPYNDDTKHLLGTKDEAPDFYKYWED